MLNCMASCNPTYYNTLPISATGLSPFLCSQGHQPPLFSTLGQEDLRRLSTRDLPL